VEITVHFTNEEQAQVEAQASAAGLSAEDWLRRVACEQASRPSAAPEAPRPISKVIAEIMSDVPEEELAKLPQDGAEQVDHYVYGHPKR